MLSGARRSAGSSARHTGHPVEVCAVTAAFGLVGAADPGLLGYCSDVTHRASKSTGSLLDLSRSFKAATSAGRPPRSPATSPTQYLARTKAADAWRIESSLPVEGGPCDAADGRQKRNGADRIGGWAATRVKLSRQAMEPARATRKRPPPDRAPGSESGGDGPVRPLRSGYPGRRASCGVRVPPRRR